MMRVQNSRRFIGVAICLLFLVQTVWASQGEIRTMRLEVVQGNGARNVIGQPPRDPIVIRVLDQEDQPVRGATVVFTAPMTGAGGAFLDNSESVIAVTDDNGRATAIGWQPNMMEGEYRIQVLVRYTVLTAVGEIRQRNVVAGNSGRMMRILAIAGGAAAAAAVALAAGGGGDNGGGSSGPPPGTPTITFGGSTTGAPQ